MYPSEQIAEANAKITWIYPGWVDEWLFLGCSSWVASRWCVWGQRWLGVLEPWDMRGVWDQGFDVWHNSSEGKNALECAVVAAAQLNGGICTAAGVRICWNLFTKSWCYALCGWSYDCLIPTWSDGGSLQQIISISGYAQSQNPEIVMI